MKITIRKATSVEVKTTHKGVYVDDKKQKFPFTLVNRFTEKKKYASVDITFCGVQPDKVLEVVPAIAKKFEEIF